MRISNQILAVFHGIVEFITGYVNRILISRYKIYF